MTAEIRCGLGGGWEVYLEGVAEWAGLEAIFLGCPGFPSPVGGPFSLFWPRQGGRPAPFSLQRTLMEPGAGSVCCTPVMCLYESGLSVTLSFVSVWIRAGVCVFVYEYVIVLV